MSNTLIKSILSNIRTLPPTLVSEKDIKVCNMKQPILSPFLSNYKIRERFPENTKYITIDILPHGLIYKTKIDILLENISFKSGEMDALFDGVLYDPPKKYNGYRISAITPELYDEYIANKNESEDLKIVSSQYFDVSEETYFKLKKLIKTSN